MTTEQIIAKFLDWLINFIELREAQNEKDNYVQMKEYEKAAAARDREKQIMKRMPTLDDARTLRKSLYFINEERPAGHLFDIDKEAASVSTQQSPMDKAWEEYIAKFNYDDSPSEQDIKENFFKAGFNAALNHLIKK